MVIRVPALIQPVDPRVSSQRPTGCWSASILYSSSVLGLYQPLCQARTMVIIASMLHNSVIINERIAREIMA